MSVNLIPEEELRAALASHQVDPEIFAAGVREKLEIATEQYRNDPFADFSPLLKSAAAFLPLPVLAGGKVTIIASKLTSAGGFYKLLVYATLPAISLFFLLGVSIFSFAKIRSSTTALQLRSNPAASKPCHCPRIKMPLCKSTMTIRDNFSSVPTHASRQLRHTSTNGNGALRELATNIFPNLAIYKVLRVARHSRSVSRLPVSSEKSLFASPVVQRYLTRPRWIFCAAHRHLIHSRPRFVPTMTA